MHFRTRTWVIISLFCFLMAGVFWQLSARLERRAAMNAASHETNAPVGILSSNLLSSNSPSALPGGATVPVARPTAKTNAANVAALDPFAHRLANTTKSLDALLHSDQALLLRNALLDSGAPLELPIPAHLRTSGEPGAYVVQSRRPITEDFRSQLRDAQVEVVAYVPNNALLVRASAAVAERLKALPETQAVLAWEPYFKLDPALLALAVDEKSLPNGMLNVLLFPGERASIGATFDRLGVTIVSEEQSPFGPHLTVLVPVTKLVELAAVPAVQDIERHFERKPANDLTRARLRVSTNTSTANNYLNLSGANVLVTVNDTGIDATHPDLAGRVFGVGQDYSGHGTHVGGTIASSGANGPLGTNAIGSASNANFRGMAPLAILFSQQIDNFFGPVPTDSALQEGAALTDSRINNNSWAYLGETDYGIASAIWDAAARDALPGVPGSQPLTMVFAAGNGNSIETELFGSFPGFVVSPGNAKNVITVGACENRRNITNEVVLDGNSFPVWLGLTDSSNQVASFSARGNVGVGREGTSGRFKPDVVAPGTWIVSCRSSTFVDPEAFNNLSVNYLPQEVVQAHFTNIYSAYIPPEGIALYVEVVSNRFSPNPFPFLQVHIRDGGVPGPADFVGYNVGLVPVTPGTTYYSIGNTEDFPVGFDIRTVLVLTNNAGNYFQVQSNLNNRLGPNYRYESGTSQAAAAVSGVLALMQEYFATRLGRTNSPALSKALLINGARTLGGSGAIDYQISGAANGQGWGLVNITNSAPATPAVAGAAGGATGPLVFYEQDSASALVTGQSITRTVAVSGAATNFPLRITLAWTDPPGNPAVGPKLVNDLDLIVTNLLNGQVYVGNAISGVFSAAVAAIDQYDAVNNVENVYLDRRLSPSYSVTVRAHRVNVNAVTTQTNGIAQDYALVISSGSPAAGALTVNEQGAGYNPAPFVIGVTNGVALLHQRVGANSPLIVSTNGVTNQWRFFVVTNQLPALTGTNAGTQIGTPSNIAFLVFQAPNLSWPRTNNADVDLYVSTNPALTNLDQTAIATSYRSLSRGGTESVILPNVVPGTIYYAGVKSEDQMAGEFGFFAVSSSSPFSSSDTNGNIVAQGYVLPAEIPDGAPDAPEAAQVFAFVTEPVIVQNVTVTNAVTHGNLGDLLGVLDHNQRFSTLNNGQGNPPGYTGSIEWIFDDSDSGQIVNATPTDAPGTLRNFVGEEGSGVWQMTMIDSSQFFTGRVDNFVVTIEPRSDDLTNGTGIVRTILPNRFFYTVVDVPNDATNLQVCAAPDFGPVEIYVRRGAFPDRQNYDSFAFVAPPGGCLELTRRDSPPLSAGRYYIGIYNPNSTPVTARIKVTIGRDLQKSSSFAFRSGGSQTLLDDATTNAIAHVFRNQQVADVRVGVRIDHPRVSDLVMHLISPSGTRVLLSENRGGPNGADFGFGTPELTIVPISSIGGPAQTNIDLILGGSDGTLEVDYDFFSLPDRMTVYYENELLFDSGLVSGGGTFSVDFSGFSTNLTIIMNEGGNQQQGTLWVITAKILTGVTYANFTDNTTLARLPIKFEPPPFTNINYSVTNYFTNATLVNNGFEDGLRFPEYPYFTGQFVTGWFLSSGEVNTMGTGATNAPWFTAPYEGQRFLDINGDTQGGVIQTNFPTVPGREYRVTYAYAYNPASSNGASAEVRVYDSTPALLTAVQVNPDTNMPGVWVTNIFVFTPSTDVTLLEIASLTSGVGPSLSAGVFFDSILVEQVTTSVQRGIYYQPEEPLSIFRGENAFGDWRLEIWDSRAGAALTNSVLLAWRLNLTFVNTNPPVVALSNGVSFCGTVGTNQAAYFVVNVPLSASVATNNLTASGDVDLVYNPFGVPLVSPGNTNFLTGRPDGFTLLGTNGWNSFDTNGLLIDFGPQPLHPGRRYYLAVYNPSETTPVDFCLSVQFDRLDAELVNVRPVTNPCVTATINSTNLFDYYSVDLASNVLQFTVKLDLLTADLGLVVKPNPPPLPNYNFYYQRSDNPGLAPELIDIVDFTGMLLPGRWYIGVYNVNQGDVGYQLCVSQTTGKVIPLGTGGDYTNTLASGGIDYYKVNILSNSCVANFCAYSTNADIDIYVGLDRLLPVNMTPTNTSLVGTNPGIPSAECVVVSAFSATNQLTNGCWIMAVVNRSALPANYYVEVTQQSDCFTHVELTNCLPFTNTITSAGGADVYQFFVSNSAVQATFEVFGMNTNVDLYLKYGVPVPVPGPANYDYASASLDLTNEFVVVVTNYPALLQPGWWFLSVSNATGATNATYAVRACQLQTNQVRRLASVPVCNTVSVGDSNMPNSGVHFYAYNVATGAVQVTFELYNLNNNVDLFVQRSPPLTNFTTYYGDPSGYPFASTNLGNTNESICFATNSPGLTLSPGPWFITVVNRDTNAASYCLRATQLTSTNFVRLTNNIASCGQFPGPRNGNDVRFYSFNVATNAIATFFEAFNISPNGDVDIFVQRDLCLPNFNLFNPASTNYPYAGTNLGAAGEWVCVATNSGPVPLAAGDWFIAVVNRSTNFSENFGPVGYCVRASEVFDTNVVRLVDGQMFCTNQVLPTAPAGVITDYYVFNVSTAAVQAVFETLRQNSTNLDIFVNYGPCFPNLAGFAGNYPYPGQHASNITEYVCVATNSQPVPLTNGDWFVAVRRQGTPADYCIRATQLLSNNIILLANGERTCNTVLPTNSLGNSGVNYHAFHVSSNAVMATFEVTLTNGNVDAYLQHGLCTTNLPGYRGAVTNYPYVSTNLFTNAALSFYPYASTNLGTNTELICVVSNSLPVPLQEGDWYLAVVNRSTNNIPVDYCVRAFEVRSDEITELTNRVPITGVILEATNAATGSGIDYYHYRVASNGIQINVETLFLDGNVDLYALRGPCWTDPAQFSYSSKNLGLTNEAIFIATNSTPVALAPGDWYFAVVNRSPPPSETSYAIRLIEFLDTDVIPLTNCSPYVNTVVLTNYTTGDGFDYYVLNVPTNSLSTTYEIVPRANPSNIVQNVNAYLRRALVLPRNNSADYYSTNGGTNAEYFVVDGTSVPRALAPGLWFLAVENAAVPTNFFPGYTLAARATYSVRVAQTTTSDVTRLTNGRPFANTVAAAVPGTCKPVDYYVFNVSTNALETVFKTFAANGNVDLFLRRSPLPSSTNFDRGSMNPGSANEFIAISTNDSPVRLAPGDWYLAVVNRDPGSVSYTICATEYVIDGTGAGGIVRLTNGIAFSNAVPAADGLANGGRQYYVFSVSNSAIQANFETYGASGNVDLYLRRGVPLPSDTLFDAASVHGGTTNELIILVTNALSLPVVLTPGNWFVTVINREPGPVTYAVRATQYIIGPNGDTNSNVTRLTNSQCISNTIAGAAPPDDPRFKYYVFTVSPSSVRAHFEILSPSANVDLIVRRGLPLPVLTNYQAISARPGTCEELITLFTNGTSLQLTQGNWYVAVINTNPTPVSYMICASEYPTFGTNVLLSSPSISSNTLCLTWTNVLPGVSYHVQAKPNLSVSNWTAISPTLRSTNSAVTWCVNLPTSMHFFRIKEGLAPKPISYPITIIPFGGGTCGADLFWSAPTNYQFVVEWSSTLVPADWRSFSDIVTSTTGSFLFTDDCSQFAPSPFRFYRVLLIDP